jgi:hypothetical protein
MGWPCVKLRMERTPKTGAKDAERCLREAFAQDFVSFGDLGA